MNLRFDLKCADKIFDELSERTCGAYPKVVHPRTVMLWMGISYYHAIPRPHLSEWWFINCRNVPSELPPCLSVLSDEEVSIDQSDHGIVISEKPIDGDI
jgi:hypothetical protein